MPYIDITESDLSFAGGLNASSNVVYVPGFVAYINPNKKPAQFPHLFRTVDEFKAVFSDNENKFKYVKTDLDTATKPGHTLISVERGVQYALTLLNLGLPVLFDPLNGGNSIDDAEVTINDTTYAVSEATTPAIDYASTSGVNNNQLKDLAKTRIENRLNSLANRNLFDVKFITSGGYENYGEGLSLYSTMLSKASTRGDCTALIDHLENSPNSAMFYNGVDYEAPNLDSKFGAMFTPWCNFQLPSFESFEIGRELKSVNMPGSLAYLMAYANSMANNNASWLAIAGASRGTIPYLVKPLVELTEAHIKDYSCHPNYTGVAINPIANINPYGTIIWGNRTLHVGSTGLVASSFLNIRQLCGDIKKTLYAACKGLTFEQNSDILWVKFKSLVTPLLDQMQTGDGISGYELKKKKTTKKATMAATLRIYPIEAVEDFEITLELADELAMESNV